MKRILSFFIRLHVATYRASGGRIAGTIAGRPLLLLTTTGKKTGKQRVAPVASFRDGEDYIVVASFGGAPTHPAWYTNLVANPEVGVEVEGKNYRARASTVTGTERARLWQQVVTEAPTFAGYGKKTEGKREIPLVRLVRLP